MSEMSNLNTNFISFIEAKTVSCSVFRVISSINKEKDRKNSNLCCKLVNVDLCIQFLNMPKIDFGMVNVLISVAFLY